MAGTHPKEVDQAFSGNNELRKRVHAAIDQNPTQSTLFRDISTYILNGPSASAAEPASKKRKLDDTNGAQNGATTGSKMLLDAASKPWRQYPATSFSIPQRKKLTLELVLEKRDGGIRGIGVDGSVEFGIAWKDVDQVFCLPVPEKAKRQHYFIVLPVHGDGVNPVPEGVTPPDPIVWTFEEATGKNIVEGEDPGPTPMADAIHHCLLQAGTRKPVVFPDAKEFASALVQNHRKGEKAYHVKAHRGSKEGYLFFTSVGILWGFKKPLAYFDFASISSVSYTNILRNTFNIVIGTASGEIEFGMVDQADHPGIEEYVQIHQLNNASMAAERKAKKLNVNKIKEEGGENGVEANREGEDGETELQKAERLLQEEEDEDEEDYDPEAEGSDSGSGDSEEDDDEDDEEEEGEEYDEVEGEEYEEGYEEGDGDEMEGQE